MKAGSAGSLFSGAGGMDLGLEAAGLAVRWQAEIDPWASKVLDRHWPEVPNLGDVQGIDGAVLPPVDVLAFGSPCQDLSVAGQRSGLDGKKSHLFFEATRIVREMREATNGQYPAWVVWENVVGALSSSEGRDFGTVLDELADAGALVIEWRVLDARWFGVPQRRRRVFVVAGFSARDDDGPPILADIKGVYRNPSSSGASGQTVTALTATGVGTCGADDNQAQAGHLVPLIESGTSARHGSRFGGEEMSSLVPLAVSENQRGEVNLTPYFRQITTGGGKPGQGYPAALHETPDGLAVRKLTPRECERLMGWPDDHTRWTPEGQEIADVHRYRMCGNGVVAEVAKYVAKQVLAS